MHRLALLLILAQLAAISAPCPVAPAWQAVEAARALEGPPPCPEHAAAQHAGAANALFFIVFRCPCGCGDGAPPSMGAHYSRVGVLPAALSYAAAIQAPQFSSEPPALAPQREPSGIKHVPRAV